ncbi:MAG TPA: glycine betaine ABC transporter substrate-binding protein [Hyphomicrobiales bacterium]|nr:glycine betaine ABC transporter substrate-binding protein [Hyphomicrobiales bacterium]
MDDRLAAQLRLLPDYLAQHVVLSAAALALGVAIALPLALLAARRPAVRWPVMAAASLVQTIPGLALLALFYPLLLGISALTAQAFGFAVPALGFLPALLALALYSMLPILRNGVAGLTGLDPAVLEAADGVGMTKRQRLLRVELPLAAPVVMAGIRTAAVWTIGTATLATPVGQTSLGNFIFSGLQTENWIAVLVGCIAAALLALVVDQLLGLIEWGAARRDPVRILAGLAVLIAGTLAALSPLLASGRTTYVIGAKNFSEQFILSDLIGSRLEKAGFAVAHKDGLGSAVIFQALAAGDIDVYVDYTGTLWENVIGRHDVPPRDAMLRETTRWMAANKGVTVLGALGFENAYALAMKADRARALGVRTIADLAPHAPDLRLGADLEFLSRPEWAALKAAYGLNFKATQSYNPTFMYRALDSGAVDVISAFSSDGRIAADRLAVLGDPKGALPSYDAVVLLSPRRARDQALRTALAPLLGAIPVELMRQANLMVDRANDKRSPHDAAEFLAAHLGR